MHFENGLKIDGVEVADRVSIILEYRFFFKIVAASLGMNAGILNFADMIIT